MITLRLDPVLEQNLQQAATRLGITKSELIRKSISNYLAKVSMQSPWELGENLFGNYSSDFGNLSTDRKSLIRKKLSAQRK